MSRDKTAVRVQRATGWSYTRSLHFVRSNGAEAIQFADTEGVMVRDAFVRMAKAEAEFEAEVEVGEEARGSACSEACGHCGACS